MPSSSARCAQFPRAQDKVHFYIKLRELRDHLKGVRQSTEIEEVAYSFDLQLAKGKLSNLNITAEWNLFSKRKVDGCTFYINRGCQEGGHKGGAVRSWL